MGYYDDNLDDDDASKDSEAEIAVGAVKGRDSDVPHIQDVIAYLVAAVVVLLVDIAVVAVSTLSNFLPEGEVIIYEMFDEMYFLYHLQTSHGDFVVFVIHFVLEIEPRAKSYESSRSVAVDPPIHY